MTTSPKKRILSKPRKGEKIDLFDLSFVRARNRNKIHSALLEEFARSDTSKAEIAEMLGKRPEQITRWLSGPSNLTLDTISDLLFALQGVFFELECKDELARGKSNARSPEWLTYTASGSTNWMSSTLKCENDVSRKKSVLGRFDSEQEMDNVRYTAR